MSRTATRARKRHAIFVHDLRHYLRERRAAKTDAAFEAADRRVEGVLTLAAACGVRVWAFEDILTGPEAGQLTDEEKEVERVRLQRLAAPHLALRAKGNRIHGRPAAPNAM